MNPTTGSRDFNGPYTYDANHPYLTGNVIGPAGDTDKFIEGTYTNNSSIEVVVTADPNYVPKLAVPGDFDSDLDVDSVDLDLVTGNYFGANVDFGYFYADGDTDTDGDVDNADIGVVIGALGGLVPSGSAELTYDASTGNVTLDASAAAGAVITSFQLENAEGSFVAANYNYNALSGGAFAYSDVFPDVLGDSDTTGLGFSGIADLGNVFPTGMNLAALEAYLTTAVYTGAPGSGQQEFDLVVVGAVSSEYEDWAGGSNFEDDDNGDGVKNGIAFILGAADPNVDAVGLLPVEATEPGFLTLTFNRVNPIGDAVLSVEYGGDLTLANSDVIPAASATLPSGVEVVVTSPGAPDPDTVVVKIPDSFAAEPGNLFARLKATETTEN